MKWRILMSVVAVATLGWSAWWFVGAGARDRAIADWMADRRAEGWQAEAAAIDTRGFPNRFDTRIDAPALADPAQGWAWSAPFLDVMTLSYEPNAAIVAFPPVQNLSVPGARGVVSADSLRASLRLSPGLSLALSRASAVGEALAAEGPGWRVEAARLEAHVRFAPDAPGMAPGEAYETFFGFEGLMLPAALRARLDPQGRLPAMAETARIDALVTLDRPLDRAALETRPPAIRALRLREAEARWGALALSMSGDLRADAAGFAEGALEVRAENWRQMLQVAVTAGALSPDLARLIEGGLSFVAALSGDGDALTAPLRFADGQARIGPVPIGRAPWLGR